MHFLVLWLALAYVPSQTAPTYEHLHAEEVATQACELFPVEGQGVVRFWQAWSAVAPRLIAAGMPLEATLLADLQREGLLAKEVPLDLGQGPQPYRVVSGVLHVGIGKQLDQYHAETEEVAYALPLILFKSEVKLCRYLEDHNGSSAVLLLECESLKTADEQPAKVVVTRKWKSHVDENGLLHWTAKWRTQSKLKSE